jgi:beta-phosphoglucomutase family hydrolase
MVASMTADQAPIDWSQLEAVLFDLDGVLTDTARLHVAAWTAAFDDFLRRRADAAGRPFVPFDPEDDYHRYVDGKPRYDGVRDFLRSRGIDLPEGTLEDPPGDGTVQALGNAKNERVHALFDTLGVDVFEGSVAFLDEVLKSGRRAAVVTSSANCDAVLSAAGLSGRFEAQVDAHVARARSLPGKPAPDTFLAAASDLGIPAARCVVVEDALSGVEAGRRGDFGLVIGVDRKGVAEDLRDAGADVVCSDLAELVPGLVAAGGPS